MTISKVSYLISLLGCGAALTAGAALAQAAPAPDAPSDLTVQVSEFRFTGNTALSSAELASLLKNFPGRALTLDQLNRAAEEVQALYRSKGWFLARAYVPPQGTKDGVVEIAILEGRIDKVSVTVAGDAPISQAKAEAVANAYLHSGDLISDRGIEHPLLLLRDVPRVAAKSVLEPGSTVGTANLAISVENDLTMPVFTGRVELDNYGTRATGRTRLTGEANINNPYGAGDQLSLRAFLANEKGNAFGRASYTLPAGPYGTRVGLSLARLNYQLGQEFAALNPTGVANVVSFNASQPLLRSKDANMLAQVVIERKKLTDEIEALGTSETSSLHATTFSVNGDWRDSPASANQYSISLAYGRLAFDDPLRRANDESPVFGLHAAGSYTKSVLMARRMHNLGDGLQALIGFNGQVANKNLPGAEKFALGGPTSVRAFPLGEVIGDQGYSVTFELQYALPALRFAGCTVAATGFYDFGHARINHTNPSAYSGFITRTIGGVGAGLNADCANGLMLRFAVAAPTQGKQPDSNGSRAWIMAGYGF